MADRLVAWLGAGVLTAGMCAATVAGGGPAAAEDGATAGSGVDASSEAADSTGAEVDSSTQVSDIDADADPADGSDEVDGPDGDDPDPADPDDADEADDADESEDADEPDDDAEDAGRPRNHDGPTEDGEQQITDEPASRGPGDEDLATDDVDAEETSDVVVEPAERDDDLVTVTTGTVSETPIEAASEPSEPNIVGTIASTVSSVITRLLNPFAASSTPATPAAQPQMWTLMAAARREFETAFESPSLEQQPAEVQNSLTYTPPPSFQDRIVLMIHETLSVIRKVTGVDLHAIVGAALASESPPFFLTFGLDTRRTVFTAEDGVQWRVWEFHPPNPTEKTVLAFHGGGFIYEPNVLHWIDYTSMARETGATVIVPLYPLATTEAGRATVVIPEAADFISNQIDVYGAENVSVYGDSAGSIIAIAAVRQLLLAGRPVPSSMVLVGMAADYVTSNPDIYEVDDPLFDLDNLSAWDSHWLDGITDPRDPLVRPLYSPLFFEPEVLKALPPTTLYVGEREIVYPDTLLLHERAVAEGAPISVVVGTGLVHDWPISGLSLLGYTQTAVVRPDVYRQLGLTDDATVDAVANLQAAEAIPAVEAPSIDEQVAPVGNSLTYTPPPSFQDRITLGLMEVFSVISDITGVDVTVTLGRLLATRTPPFFLTFGLDTRRTAWTAEDGTQWDVWEIRPPEPTGKTVLAFHGGGFILEPSVLNWIDYTNMARQTGATVVVPLYPLATTEEGAAREVVPEAADFISDQLAARGAENVSVYADSAGTAISIAAIRELLLAGKPVPSSMVLLSPVVDSSLSNPDIRDIDDPLFDVDNAVDVWPSHYFDGITDRRDPLVSALFFETEVLKALPPTTIYTGEREILYPDTLLLHQRAVEEGAPISVVVGTGLVHGWAIAASPIPTYSQAVAVRPDVYRQLGLTDVAAVAAVAEVKGPNFASCAEDPSASAAPKCSAESGRV